MVLNSAQSIYLPAVEKDVHYTDVGRIQTDQWRDHLITHQNDQTFQQESLILLSFCVWIVQFVQLT